MMDKLIFWVLLDFMNSIKDHTQSLAILNSQQKKKNYKLKTIFKNMETGVIQSTILMMTHVNLFFFFICFVILIRQFKYII